MFTTPSYQATVSVHQLNIWISYLSTTVRTLTNVACKHSPLTVFASSGPVVVMLQAWAEDKRVCGALARTLYVVSKEPGTYNMHTHTYTIKQSVLSELMGILSQVVVSNLQFRNVLSECSTLNEQQEIESPLQVMGHPSTTGVIHLIKTSNSYYITPPGFEYFR